MPTKPMTRVPLTKKMRFDIFRRDLYTCRYCGGKPPEVLLEIDHIIPISAGGKNEATNLATACRDCNAGKSATVLDEDEIDRKEEHFLFLQSIQEWLEARDFSQAHAEYEMDISFAITQIQDTFMDITEDKWMPADQMIRALAEYYDWNIAKAALVVTAQNIRSETLTPKGDAWVKYTWGCARNMVAIPEVDVLIKTTEKSE